MKDAWTVLRRRCSDVQLFRSIWSAFDTAWTVEKSWRAPFASASAENQVLAHRLYLSGNPDPAPELLHMQCPASKNPPLWAHFVRANILPPPLPRTDQWQYSCVIVHSVVSRDCNHMPVRVLQKGTPPAAHLACAGSHLCTNVWSLIECRHIPSPCPHTGQGCSAPTALPRTMGGPYALLSRSCFFRL